MNTMKDNFDLSKCHVAMYRKVCVSTQMLFFFIVVYIFRLCHQKTLICIPIFMFSCTILFQLYKLAMLLKKLATLIKQLVRTSFYCTYLFLILAI